jgi:hypothetical protein
MRRPGGLMQVSSRKSAIGTTAIGTNVTRCNRAVGCVTSGCTYPVCAPRSDVSPMYPVCTVHSKRREGSRVQPEPW